MSKEMIREEVPPFTRRLGDHVIHGSNNTVIILGTDRASKGPAGLDAGLGHSKADGSGKGTGSIHMIAGRRDASGNPDFVKDSSFVYLSMKTAVDKNLDLSDVEKESNDLPALIGKSDAVRFVFRKDLKISSEDGKRYIYADDKYMRVKIGQNSLTINDDGAYVEVGNSKVSVEKQKTTVTVGGSTFVMKPTGMQMDTGVLKVGGGAVVPRQSFFDALVDIVLNHAHAAPVITTTGPAAAHPGTLPLAAKLRQAQINYYQSVYGPPNV